MCSLTVYYIVSPPFTSSLTCSADPYAIESVERTVFTVEEFARDSIWKDPAGAILTYLLMCEATMEKDAAKRIL